MKKDYIKEIKDAERRFVTEQVEFREEGEKRTVIGYAAKFDKESHDLGGFTEKIDRSAFDDVLNDDTMALFNHDPNLVLARNNKTLKLSVDKVGLRYEFEAPNTTSGNDLTENLRLGNVDKSSFAFSVKDEEWQERDDENKPVLRIIKKVKRLFDIAPVTYPAYQDTSVALRSLDAVHEKDNKEALEIRSMKHKIMKLKNQIKIG